MEPAWDRDSWAWNPVAMTALPVAKGAEVASAAMKPQVHASAQVAGMPGATCTNASAPHQHQGPKRPVHRPKCQVPGCGADLAHSRAYYRRYRICESHFRLPSMMLNAQEVRFCQQCAKFEPIGEFEGNKRSCRRQLNRHNERRKGRKMRARADGGRAAVDSADEASDDSCTGQRGAARASEHGLPGMLSNGAAGDVVMSEAASLLQQAPLTAFQKQLLVQDILDQVAAAAAADVVAESCQPAAGSQQQQAGASRPGPQGPQQQQQVAGEPEPLTHRSLCHSLSDVTVQASKHQGLGEGSTQQQEQAAPESLDAALVAAAQELLATWQQEEEGGANNATSQPSMGLSVPGMEAAGSSRPASNHGVAGLLATQLGAAQQLPQAGGHAAASGSKREPGSADSSVHGPSANATPTDTDGSMSRVLELLSKNHYFDCVRSEGPVVQPAGAAPSAAAVQQLLLQQQPPLQLPFAAPAAAQLGLQQPMTSPFTAASMMGNIPPGMLGAMQPGMQAHNSNMSDARMGAFAAAGSEALPPMIPTANAGGLGSDHFMGGAPAWMKGRHGPPAMPQGPALGLHGAHGPTELLSAGSTADMLDVVPPHWQLPPRQAPAAQPQGLGGQSMLANSPPNCAPALHPLLANLQPSSAPAASASAPHYPNVFNAQPSGGWGAAPGSMGGVGMGMGRASGFGSTTDLMQQASSTALGRKLGQANYLLVELSLTRLSIKLHGVTPEALPMDLRAALTEWLAHTDVRLLQGFIRPGCVHLSLDCIQVPGAKAEPASSSSSASPAATTMSTTAGTWAAAQAPRPCASGQAWGLDELLQLGLGGAHAIASLPRSLAALFSSCTIVELQSPSKLVLMEGEAVWSITQLDKRPALPTIHAVSPLVLLAGSQVPQVLRVTGEHLEGSSSKATAPAATATPGPQLLVRSSGQFVQTGVAAAPASEEAARGAHGQRLSCWHISLDASKLRPGLAVVECQSGRLLSNWQPVLVVDDVGVLHELQQLQPLQAAFPDRVQCLVTGLALLLQLQSQCSDVAAAAAHAAANGRHGAGAAGHADAEAGEGSSLGGDDAYLLGEEEEEDDDLTAPSVSDLDEDMWDDAFGGPDDVMHHDQLEQHDREGLAMMGDDFAAPGGHEAYPAGAGGAARAVREVLPPSRIMSWDSEFGELGPMVHSSWGSTATTSLLAGALQQGEQPVRDVEMAFQHARGSTGGYLTLHGTQQGPVSAPLSRESATVPGQTVFHSMPLPAPAPLDGAAAPQPEVVDAFPPEVRAGLVRKALRLLAFACDAGWPCTTRLLVELLTTLPLVPAAAPASAGPAQLVPLTTLTVLASTIGADGLTPLHRAARSGSVATLKELLLVAASAGLRLNLAARGNAAVSPLHCAAHAVHQVGPGPALLLLDATADAALQWFVARCAEGRTPAQECGHAAVNLHALRMVQVLANRQPRVLV